MRTATTRTITGRVAGNGSVLAGSGFAVQRTAAGIYSMTFDGRLLGIDGVLGNIYGFFRADTFTGNGCRVIVANVGATANVDSDFVFTATLVA